MASVITNAFRNTSKFSSSLLFNIKTAGIVIADHPLVFLRGYFTAYSWSKSLLLRDIRTATQPPYSTPFLHIFPVFIFVRIHQSRKERRGRKSSVDYAESTEGVERPLRWSDERSLGGHGRAGSRSQRRLLHHNRSFRKS